MIENHRIEEIVTKQRRYFSTGATLDVETRLRVLNRLKMVIQKNENKIEQALYKDLKKSGMESYMTEIGMALAELNDAIRHLRSWARPKWVATPLNQFPARSYMISEPYGVALVIAPWNYPFLLCIEPLIGAIAAGNCCVMKPSDDSRYTSALISDLIRECFSEEYVAVVEGGKEENLQLLSQKFDYIFFTGSVSVGKIVMEKAASNLIPVTLELGGKSPCIVDKSANIRLAAKRIVFGKFLNCGQTCIAPDYVLIHQDVQKEFLSYAIFYTKKMFKTDAFSNPDYPKIINQKHYDRILGLIDKEKIAYGGNAKKETLQIEPTILENVTADDKIMQEEIFGPVLPIMSFQHLSQAEKYVSEHPKPLACYIFTKNPKVEKRLLAKLSFGGGCVNDTIIHLTSKRLAFGGVGESGMGSYHGKHSFDTFSHKKGIISQTTRIDVPIRYQPYSSFKKLLVKLFLR